MPTPPADKWEERFRKLDWSVPPPHIQEYLGMTKWFDEKVDFIKETILLSRKELLDEIEGKIEELFPAWLDEVEPAGNEPPEDPLLAADQAVRSRRDAIRKILKTLRLEK